MPRTPRASEMPHRRTPENVAAVNGAHSARTGDDMLTEEAFAARYPGASATLHTCYRSYVRAYEETSKELRSGS